MGVLDGKHGSLDRTHRSFLEGKAVCATRAKQQGERWFRFLCRVFDRFWDKSHVISGMSLSTCEDGGKCTLLYWYCMN